jgi:ribosomal protein S25
MKEKARAATTGKYVKVYTEEDFIKALNECMKEATVTADEVAEKLGCNPRFARNELYKIASQNKINKKLRGNKWGFRP